MLASERKKSLIAETQSFVVSEVDKAPELADVILASEGQGIGFRCCDWLPLDEPGRESRFGFTFYGREALPLIILSTKIFMDTQRFRNTLLQEVIHAFAQTRNTEDQPSENGRSPEYGLAQIRAITGATIVGGAIQLLLEDAIQSNVVSCARWDVQLEEHGVDRKFIDHARNEGEYLAAIVLATMSPDSGPTKIQPPKPLS